MDNREKKSKFLEEGKLIVSRLARKTTVSELREHFQKYGIVSEAFIYGKENRRNRRQHLNGFVVFKYPQDIINVLAEDQHIIDDRPLQIERADRFKIFVQGLPYIISEKAVRECFEECGKIKKVQFERWNCVITFSSTEAVEQAVNLPPILLKGNSVTVKRAPEHPEGAAAPEHPEGAAAPEHPEGAAAPEHPEGPEGAAAVSLLSSLILFVKERIQDILNWCRLRIAGHIPVAGDRPVAGHIPVAGHRPVAGRIPVAGHRPLPPWRDCMLREETRFRPRMTDDPATQARHVKLARAAFARATIRDNEIEDDDDDDIRVVPHDYFPPADKSLQEKFNEVYNELDLEKWD